ncbi:MAG: hypothetical protein ACHQD8_01840 [Chitinophagales bacterium]
MDIVEIFLLFFLSYRNSVRAKLKGQNGLLWGVITAVFFIMFHTIGLYVVIALFCRNEVDMSILANSKSNFEAVSKQLNDQVIKALMDNPLREITVFLFALGGYLLVHYLIERKPDKKEPEVHWMDKMGKN